MKHIVWILFLHHGWGIDHIEGFKDYASCEAAYVSIVQQDKGNGSAYQYSDHACIGIEK